MINEELYTLYYNKLSKGCPCMLQLFRQMRREANAPSYPLFLKINEEQYCNADVKIIVFGQETNSWEHKICPTVTPVDQSIEIVDDTVKGFMDYYRNFFDSKDINSPFWQYIKKIKKILSSNLPNKTIEIVWNNIYKIGNKEKNRNRPVKSIRDFENTYFNVIQDEIDILKPDIILFFTGPDYDRRVIKIFPTICFKPFVPTIRQKELAKLQLENNISAYRTYHPNYLQLNKKEEFIRYICNDLLI